MGAGGVLRVVFILPIVVGSHYRVTGDKAHYEAERHPKSHYRKYSTLPELYIPVTRVIRKYQELDHGNPSGDTYTTVEFPLASSDAIHPPL